MKSLGALAAHGSFPPTAESIAAARRLVRNALRGWAVGEVTGDALLIASELCTNAVIHAGTEFTVSCTHLGGAIRLAVRDGYPVRTLPTAVTAPGGQQTSGRGLLLCAALSSAWGVDYDKTGKLVWCQLDLPGAESGPVQAGPGPLIAAITLDSAGRVRDWTAPATELLGWSAADVTGRPFAELATDRRVIDGEAAGWAGATELLVLDAAGHRVPLQARLVPVGSEHPSVVLLAPAGDPWAFVLATPPEPAQAERSGDALAAFDSDRVPAHELPQRAAEACCDYLGGDAAYLMLVDENGDLRMSGSTGLDRMAQSYTEPTEDVLRASPERMPQVVGELADNPGAPPPLLAAGMHAAVSVPVLVDGRLIGQLTVAAAAPGRFGPEDAVRLHLAAGQLGRPLDRARITDLERRRRGWLSYLAEASDLLSGTLEPQATVAVLAQLLVPRLATWCGVRMTDDRGRSKLAYVWHADEPVMDALRLLLDNATDPPARGSGVPFVLADGAETGPDGAELAGLPAADTWRIRSGPVASFALTARGRTLGTVLVGREPGERFGRDTLGLAEEICRRAALILDNALLYSDNLATSHALQASLLPAELPQVSQLDVGVAYQAKGEGHDVGGDFYDLYETEPDCWRFTIGDVCGSGPAAAAITGLARNTLRILGRQGLPLTAVLTELNSLIRGESVGSSRFLTALHGEIRPAAGGGVHLKLVAAGHPTPYLVHGARPPEPVTKPQPLLGVLPEVAYVEQELTLAPGQVLVCLTDGVLERRDGERMLGELDLAAVLARTSGVSAGAGAAQVQQAVIEYSAEPAKDDFAVLVLRAV